MKIEIKNWVLITVMCVTLLSVFSLGWILGRRNYQSTVSAIVVNQSSIINDYIYRVGDLQSDIREKNNLLVDQIRKMQDADKDREELKEIHKQFVREVHALRKDIKGLRDSLKVYFYLPPVRDSIPKVFLPQARLDTTTTQNKIIKGKHINDILDINPHRINLFSKDRIGLGVVVGYGRNPKDISQGYPYFGVGLSYNIIQLKKRGS